MTLDEFELKHRENIQKLGCEFGAISEFDKMIIKLIKLARASKILTSQWCKSELKLRSESHLLMRVDEVFGDDT